jgi:Putative zinc-finger
MICNEARPLLDLLCDGVLPAKESAMVVDHLTTCDNCQPEWTALEQLRARFLEAKQKVQMPSGLMTKISDSMRREDRDSSDRIFRKFLPPVLAAGVAAAAVAVVDCVVIPWLSERLNPAAATYYKSRPAPIAKPIPAASTLAEFLIDNCRNNGKVEGVSNPNQLEPKLGYRLKYLRLPAWRLAASGVYRAPSVAVARFDFVKGHCGVMEQVTCYQAPAGAINASAPKPQDKHGKHVIFGNRGDMQFALWTQDERDYLFVTRLPKATLEEIASGT